jgi:O-methyltransferase
MTSILSDTKRRLRLKAREFTNRIHHPMRFPTYSAQVSQRIAEFPDDTRYATLALALARLDSQQIEGAIAELGVYQGATSKFLHDVSPHRKLYLFDTFEGFPDQALQAQKDTRFRDTSKEAVARHLSDLTNVFFQVGYFPKTTAGLESERFALVMLDFDLYSSALDGLKFFYPRMVTGGYFFLHDFNSPESDHAISRAANEFLKDKPEMLIEIPDEWGSVVFRKIAPAE